MIRASYTVTASSGILDQPYWRSLANIDSPPFLFTTLVDFRLNIALLWFSAGNQTEEKKGYCRQNSTGILTQNTEKFVDSTLGKMTIGPFFRHAVMLNIGLSQLAWCGMLCWHLYEYLLINATSFTKSLNCLWHVYCSFLPTFVWLCCENKKVWESSVLPITLRTFHRAWFNAVAELGWTIQNPELRCRIAVRGDVVAQLAENVPHKCLGSRLTEVENLSHIYLSLNWSISWMDKIQ